MLLTKNNIDEIQSKCKLYNVKNLYLFGSAARNDFNSESDIDLLVDFENISPEDYFEYYYNLKDYLSKYFQREIDLLEFRALTNPYLIEEINKNKILIYGKAN